MNRLAQHINGIKTAVTMKRELETFREAQRHASHDGSTAESASQASPNDVGSALEIMDDFTDDVGPSLYVLMVST